MRIPHLKKQGEDKERNAERNAWLKAFWETVPEPAARP